MLINPIASGSSGNAYYISDGQSSLLLDAGIPLAQIQAGCGYKVSQLSGCLVTHGHGDHVKAAKALARMGVNIYTSQGTADMANLTGHRICTVRALESFHAGTFEVLMGPLAQADMAKSGVLASVTTAQAILESGHGSTELARNANNFFGMKCSLSGNTWPGSTWDGVSKYRKQTGEEDANGNAYTITADFRKYASAADSVADHSAYLLGAMNGSKQRYAGLKGEMDPAKAIGIIKAGGYATDTRYVNKVLSIISKYNLTKYDQAAKGGVSNLKINQNPNFGTHNTSPRSGEIEYIVIHYVGATGTAKNNIDYYNQRSTTQASADFYVGFEGEKWQYNPNPKARYCWAVGGGKQSSYGGSLYGVARNANSVSIEMCVRNKGNKNANSKDWYFEQATIDSAVELTKYLMKLYGVPASRVIRHFDVNGKLCPGVYGWNSASGSESAWNDFKKRIGSAAAATPATPGQPAATEKKYYRVRKSWADAASQKGAFTSLANAKACADQNSGYKVFDWNGSQVYPAAAFQPYQVRVEITDLRIRKGAGTNYDYWTEKNGQSKYTGKGTFTIVKEKNGAGATKWGLLKAYEKNADGWISLDYVKRV